MSLLSTLFGALLIGAWAASVPLFVRAVSALNASQQGKPGPMAHVDKLLLVVAAVGYFGIVVMAPLELTWGVIGGAMVLLSRGLALALRQVVGYGARQLRRIDDAFNVEL